MSTYYALKALKRCVNCGRKLDKNLDGEYTRCLACRMDKRQYKTHRTEEGQQKQLKQKKLLRDIRVAFGVCYICGKRNVTDGYKACGICRAKMRRGQAKRRREHDTTTARELMDGITLCAICGKYPPKKGYKICDRCYISANKNLIKAKESKDYARYRYKLQQDIENLYRTNMK